jgi:UPF0716 protein FxsA
MRFRIRWAALALVVTLAAEIAVFIVIGNLIGYGLAILGLLVLMALGAVLVRREGTRTWRRYRTVAEAGERPGPHLSRALVGLVGSALLLVPGYVTSVVGLLLFLPPVRAVAAAGVTAIAGRRLASAAMGDLFGPRQVKVRTGRPSRIRATAGAPDVTSDTEPIEGEIIDPR